MTKLDFVKRFYDLRRKVRNAYPMDETRDELDALAREAYELAGRGAKAHIHAEELIFNRGCMPDDPRFYRSLHAIEDVVNSLGADLRAEAELSETPTRPSIPVLPSDDDDDDDDA